MPPLPPLSPWARAELALMVLAVDPAGLRGLWLRARAGAVRDHLTAAFAALPLPLRRLHPQIDDTALFGGIDLAATLAQGRVMQSAGILAAPAALVLAMAERCPPGLAARLARTLDDRGFCLLALDEGAEPDEALPSALTDRLGLFVDLTATGWSDSAAITPDPARLASAQAALAHVQTPKAALETLTRVAAAMDIESLRAPMLALSCARALAAWHGHDAVNDDDLQRAKLDYHLNIYPWARAYKMAQEAPYVLIYSIGRSEKREAFFKWVDVIAPYDVYLYRLKNRPEIKVNNLADLKNFKIGAVRDDIRAQYLEKL